MMGISEAQSSRKARKSIVLLAALLMGALTVTPGSPGPEVSAKDKAKSSKNEKKALPASLGLVPPDAVGFIHVRVADLWDSGLGKKLRQRFAKEANGLEKGLQDFMGLRPDELESVTMPYQSSLLLALFSGRERKTGRDERVTEKNVDQEERKEGSRANESQREDMGEPVLIVATVKAYDRDKILQAFPNAQKMTHKGKTYYVQTKGRVRKPGLLFVNKRTFVLAGIRQLRHMIDNPVASNGRGPLRPSLHLARDKHSLVGATQFVAKEGKKVSSALETYLRDQMSYVPYRLAPLRTAAVRRALLPLARLRSAGFTVDVDKDIRADVSLHFADESQRKKAAPAVRDALVLLRIFGLGSFESEMLYLLEEANDAKAQEEVIWTTVLVKKLTSALRSAKVERSKQAVSIAFRAKTAPDTLDEEARAAFKAWTGDTRAIAAFRRRKISMDLRQIATAKLNHHGTTGSLLPAAISSKDGKPLLSWRVALLPYIEQERLYVQFKLDEPWDSAHNKKLLSKMPRSYAPARGITTREKGVTFYQVFVGKGAAFEGKKGMRIPRDFPDGLSNTILVAEAGRCVPWTKPEDISYDPKKPLPKLGGAIENGFFAVMGDASVRFIKKSVSQKTLHVAITRAGAEVLGSDWDE
jgi:hypothetical protein